MMTGKNIGDLLNAAHLTWGSFVGGFNLQTVNANGTTGCARSTYSTVIGGNVTDYIPHHSGSSTTRRPPIRPMPARVRSRRSATASARRQTADPANHGYDLNDFYDCGEGRQLSVGLLHQDAGLSGRSPGQFRSAR